MSLVVLGAPDGRGGHTCDATGESMPREHERAAVPYALRAGVSIDLCDAHKRDFETARDTVRDSCHWNSKQSVIQRGGYKDLKCTMLNDPSINDAVMRARRRCYGARSRVNSYYALKSPSENARAMHSADQHEAFEHEELVAIIGCGTLSRLRKTFVPMFDELLKQQSGFLVDLSIKAAAFASGAPPNGRDPKLYLWAHPHESTLKESISESFTACFDNLCTSVFDEPMFERDYAYDRVAFVAQDIIKNVGREDMESIRVNFKTSDKSVHDAYVKMFTRAWGGEDFPGPFEIPKDRAMTFYGCVCSPAQKFLAYLCQKVQELGPSHGMAKALNCDAWNDDVPNELRMAYILGTRAVLSGAGADYENELLIAGARLM